MEVQIIKNDKNHPIGWTMKGETPEEVSKLNSIRNLQFFGFEETRIVYDGREGGDEHNAGTLTWKQYEHTTAGKKEVTDE